VRTIEGSLVNLGAQCDDDIGSVDASRISQNGIRVGSAKLTRSAERKKEEYRPCAIGELWHEFLHCALLQKFDA
jgi:hypothetical protein